MISRTYLPYKSARQYLDRGMAKWVGFFISEHSTALSEIDNEIDFSPQMKKEQILTLLNQVHLHSLTITLYTIYDHEPMTGKIIDIQDSNIYFRTDNRVLQLSYRDIIRLKLEEEE